MYRRQEAAIFTSILVTCLILSMYACDKSTEPRPEPEPEPSIGLPLARTDWIMSSKPEAANLGLRGKLLWHIERQRIMVEEVYDEETVAGQASMSIFRMILRPDQSPGVTSWGGITTSYREQLADSVVWLQVRLKGSPSATLNFDIGSVSEDVNGDGIFFTEDIDHNLVCKEDEDVGLDGLPDEDEPGYDPIANPDPNGDNWFFDDEGKCPLPPTDCESVNWDDDSLYYEWLNGTEGNIADLPVMAQPDAELTNGMVPTFSNAYRSYQIDLSSDRFLVPGSEHNGWKTYLVPFRDDTAMSAIVGTPNQLGQITNIRVWLEADPGQTVPDTVRIADWLFVGHENGSIPTNAPDTTYIRDYEYQQNRAFDLFYDSEYQPGDSVTAVYLFLESGPPYDALESVAANLYVDPEDSLSYSGETIHDMTVTEIEPSTFTCYQGDSTHNPHVIFDQLIPSYRALGAMVVVHRADQTIDTIGTIENEPYCLKLLRHHEPDPAYQSWRLMWRNCYSLPRGIPLGALNIDIFMGQPGTEGDSGNLNYQIFGDAQQFYLRITGLDQYNLQGQRLPDGKIDERYEIYRPDLGLLIFPESQPFNSSAVFQAENGSVSQVLRHKAPALYFYESRTEQVEASLYYLRLVLEME